MHIGDPIAQPILPWGRIGQFLRAWRWSLTYRFTQRLPYLIARALLKFAARRSNLVSHAKREMRGSQEEGPDKWMRDHMIELAALWSMHGHSGASNSFAVRYAERLLRFKPIGPADRRG